MSKHNRTALTYVVFYNLKLNMYIMNILKIIKSWINKAVAFIVLMIIGNDFRNKDDDNSDCLDSF